MARSKLVLFHDHPASSTDGWLSLFCSSRLCWAFGWNSAGFVYILWGAVAFFLCAGRLLLTWCTMHMAVVSSDATAVGFLLASCVSGLRLAILLLLTMVGCLPLAIGDIIPCTL